MAEPTAEELGERLFWEPGQVIITQPGPGPQLPEARPKRRLRVVRKKQARR